MGFLRRLLRARVASVAVLAILSGGYPAAQPEERGEEAIKAAFLYNFTKFIDWPSSAFAEASTPFRVCAAAGATFRRELFAILEGERVRGRPVVVTVPKGADDLRACHLVYLSREDARHLQKHVADLREMPVLTVGDRREFLDQGGLIGFFIENGRVRFVVNKTGADAAGLDISSKLLRVASDVR